MCEHKEIELWYDNEVVREYCMECTMIIRTRPYSESEEDYCEMMNSQYPFRYGGE